MTAVEVVPSVIRGSVAWVFGDDFDIDLVIGVENIKITDPAQLRDVLMSAYDPEFVETVRPGDIIVGGRNFGYGHPHYPPMAALRHVGIRAVVAESFSPGFWRGETFNGVPLVTIPGITQECQRGDQVNLHWRTGKIEILTDEETGPRTLHGEAPSARTVQTIEAGGAYNLLSPNVARRADHHPNGRVP